MADLNNTIVRGKLRVTEDINANGNITGNGITLSNVKNAGILGTDSSGKVYNNSSAYVPFDNASKDIYLGSHGIHSGTRPSSGSATLMGNGYWIQESSVGVSSAVSGGTAHSVSSEMTPSCISVGNEQIKLNTSGIVVRDVGTFKFDGNPGSVATSADLKNYQKKGNYVTTDTAQTITGKKTFNSPANVNDQEVATAIFKTSNGGQLIIGKEGPNSGTMLRFDQTAGKTRLQFRASATLGAMVWTQPEKGAKLYFDLTNSAGVSTRTTLDARSGTIARTSDIGNGKITIQKNGTDVGSFTTNQSGSKTIDLTIGVSDVSGLKPTLDGKMDTYTITSSPSSMGKDGFAQFGYDVTYGLTQYSQLKSAFGYVKVLEKGGEVSNNNSYFTGFGNVGGGTYIGTATYDRDYNFPNAALVASRGLLIDDYGSAFLLYGSRDEETKKELATKDDINSLQNSINGKVNSDDLLKITGSSGFGDTDWHYRKIGHFIFNSSDFRNGAPVHISGVIGSWAQEKMIFDIFVCTRGGLKVNGFVRGTNPSCRLVIDNTENPNIFLAIKGFATYNITVDTFENAKNENNAVRGSFHIDWTGGDDFTGSDVGVTATNFAYKDLLSRVAYQRAYYSYTGAFAETSGTATKLCEVSGGETGKIICVHGQATSTNSELSIQRRAMHYYDYDCIAIAPTGYNSGTYISCTGVVPPRLQYSATGDTPSESTYYIFGKNVSNVYVITFDLP